MAAKKHLRLETSENILKEAEPEGLDGPGGDRRPVSTWSDAQSPAVLRAIKLGSRQDSPRTGCAGRLT